MADGTLHDWALLLSCLIFFSPPTPSAPAVLASLLFL